MCSVHKFLFVIVCLIIHGLFLILLLFIASIFPVQSCALSVFLSKENWKERKTSEAWWLGYKYGRGGGVIKVLFFKGIDMYSGEGVILLELYAHMNVTMSEVSRIVKDLPNGKSSGLAGLNDESMKHARPLLCLFYLSVLLLCLNTVTCPNLWLIQWLFL